MATYPQIDKFELHNQGGYDCHISCEYLDGTEWIDTKESGVILLGQHNHVDPGNKGVPAGATIRLRLHVDAGDPPDINAAQWFTFDVNANQTAEYVSSGTTRDAHLALENNPS